MTGCHTDTFNWWDNVSVICSNVCDSYWHKQDSTFSPYSWKILNTTRQIFYFQGSILFNELYKKHFAMISVILQVKSIENHVLIFFTFTPFSFYYFYWVINFSPLPFLPPHSPSTLFHDLSKYICLIFFGILLQIQFII